MHYLLGCQISLSFVSLLFVIKIYKMCYKLLLPDNEYEIINYD